MKAKQQRVVAPDGLSPEAADLYCSMRMEWSINDSYGLSVLLAGCQALDRLRQAQDLIRREGAVTRDRYGSSRPHPAVKIENDAHARMLASWRALGLNVASAQEAAKR